MSKYASKRGRPHEAVM